MDSAPRPPQGVGGQGTGAAGGAPAKPAAIAGAIPRAVPRPKVKPSARTVKPAKAGPTRQVGPDSGLIPPKTPEEIAEANRRRTEPATVAKIAAAKARAERRESGAADPEYV